MEKQPEEIITVTLNCVLMPNGEIISLGKSIGFFDEFKKELKPKNDLSGQPIPAGTYG